MSKYQKVNELIGLWEQFENEEKNNSFYNFSLWLNNRSVREESSDDKEVEEESVQQPGVLDEQFMKYYERIHFNGRIASLMNRFVRVAQFYVKKAFKDCAVNTLLDFNFLAGVHGMGNPKKSDLISFNIVEVTTGTEIIRRLKNNGLIDETEDEQDRRSKRLSLTPKGKEAFLQCREKLIELGKFTMGSLDEKAKLNMLDSLIYLNNYHTKIYFEQFNSSIEDIIEKNTVK